MRAGMRIGRFAMALYKASMELDNQTLHTVVFFRELETETPPWHSPSWGEWETRAKLTTQIDYGCNFDDSGTCKSQRNGRYQSQPMCCCKDCHRTQGYLTRIPYGSAQYYADLFDDQTGFWRAGTGCALSRERRSSTCLGFSCNDDATKQAYDLLDRGQLVSIEGATV